MRAIPIPTRTPLFNRVILTLRTLQQKRKPRTVRASLLLDSGELLSGGGFEVRAAEGPQTLVFDFPGRQAFEGAVRSLRIETSGAAIDLALERIELVDTPLDTWLPDPDRGRRWSRSVPRRAAPCACPAPARSGPAWPYPWEESWPSAEPSPRTCGGPAPSRS